VNLGFQLTAGSGGGKRVRVEVRVGKREGVSFIEFSDNLFSHQCLAKHPAEFGF